MATIRDVAEHASVSRTTVSQTLRNPEIVHPRTRRRVEQAISELNYQPRGVGRPAQKRKQHNIALVYRDANYQNVLKSAPMRWFNAIRQRLHDGGYQLTLIDNPANDQQSDPLLRDLIERKQIHAAVFFGRTRHRDLQWAQSQNLPALAIHFRPPPGESFSFIDIDNATGAALAVDHLVQQGHRRIAMLHTQVPTHPPHYVTDRIQGFMHAMQRHRLEPVLMEEIPAVPPAGNFQPWIEKLQAAGATAVFTRSDDLAIALMEACATMGVLVPKDLSFIGFDDNHRCSIQGLRPSSIGFPDTLLAQLCSDFLQRLIAHRREMIHVSATLAPTLAPHDSVLKRPPGASESAAPMDHP